MRKLKLVAGRWFQPGQREIVVGNNLVKRYRAAQVGKQLRFGKGLWTIVGVMDAGNSAFNSEIFADGNQVASDFNRPDTYSSALLQANDEATANALKNSLENDRRLNVTVLTERDYYEAQTVSSEPSEVPRLLRLHHYGDRQLLCVHEHHVRSCGAPRQRDRHAAHSGLYARQHPVELLDRIIDVVADRWLDRVSVGATA